MTSPQIHDVATMTSLTGVLESLQPRFSTVATVRRLFSRFLVVLPHIPHTSHTSHTSIYAIQGTASLHDYATVLLSVCPTNSSSTLDRSTVDAILQSRSYKVVIWTYSPHSAGDGTGTVRKADIDNNT